MSWLYDIIKEAGKDSEGTDKEETPLVSQELTAVEQAAAKNILDMLNHNQKHEAELIRKYEERIFESDLPRDINGHENHTGEAIFYQPSTSYTHRVPGIPYAVSDVNWICNSCTKAKTCERHDRDRKPQKTDISLCSDNHLRMAVYWDISDPENRKKTWQFVIEEKYDRFRDPEQVRAEHDFAVKRGGGCKPHVPVHRIRELASRIMQDYNEDQKNKARVSKLDSKGREYYAKPQRWGGKEPFKPSEAAHVRAAYEYGSSDGSRIEAELRVLLQAWYQSKLPQSERGIDRTTANAKKIWREKMELQAMDKVAQLAGAKPEFKGKMATLLLDAMKANANEMKRFEMSTRAGRDAAAKKRVKERTEIAERLRAKEAAKSKARSAKKKGEKRRAFVDSDSESEKAKEISDDTLAVFEQMAKDVEDEDKGGKQKQFDPIVKPKVSKAPREPTAEERELLQKIKDAGEEDVQEEEEEEESAKPEPEVEEAEEEEEAAESKTSTSSLKSNKRKATASTSPSAPSAKKPNKGLPAPESTVKPKKPTATPKLKRKAAASAPSSPPAKNSRKTYKSADTISDSDSDAGYDLPSGPALALSEQREGWKIPGDVGSVEVVQTDKNAQAAAAAAKKKEVDSKKKASMSVDIVVEQGTTIVKEVVRQDTPQPSTPNSPLATAVSSPTLSSSCTPKSARAAASPAASPTLSVKAASSAPPKKRKKVSWSDDLVAQPEKKRKLSQFYAQGHDEEEEVEDEEQA